MNHSDKKRKLDELARTAFEKGGFNGTWLYAEKGEIVSSGAAGFRDLEDKAPLREDSLFDLASVSKQFTAAAVMLMRRRGLLALEDEITRFFPEIPYKGVTIRHLLNHTGGLPDYMDWVDEIAKKENAIPGNDVIVRFLRECGEEPSFAPGEQFEYSNTGYCLLAEIVQKVSGVPFEDFLRDEIFEPAGMHATRVYHRRRDRIAIENLAWGLSLPLGGDRYALPDDLPDESAAVTCDGANGDGLVHSNIFDLFRWDRALRAETVLTKEEQALMATPGRLNNGEMGIDKDEEDDPDYGYGFGWDVLEDPEFGLIVCHSGGWPGYSTWFERFVDADRVLIRLRCRDVRDERASKAFIKGLAAVARDREPEPVRSIEELAVRDPDRSGWDALCGKYDYTIADFHIHEIVLRDGALYAEAADGERPCTLRLWPLGENRFGIKDLDADLTFGDGALTLYGVTGKKTE